MMQPKQRTFRPRSLMSSCYDHKLVSVLFSLQLARGLESKGEATIAESTLDLTKCCLCAKLKCITLIVDWAFRAMEIPRPERLHSVRDDRILAPRIWGQSDTAIATTRDATKPDMNRVSLYLDDHI